MQNHHTYVNAAERIDKKQTETQDRLINLALADDSAREQVLANAEKFGKDYRPLLAAMRFAANEGHSLTRQTHRSYLENELKMIPADVAAMMTVFNRCTILMVKNGDLPGLMLALNTAHQGKEQIEELETLKDDLKETIRRLKNKTYEADEIGNAQLFADAYGDKLRYVSEWKRWLKWDGKRWEPMTPERVQLLGQELVRYVMPLVAIEITDDDRRTKYVKHIATTTSMYKVNAMIEGARGRMVVSINDLDRNPMLFNLQNGTLDCKSGEVRPHRREDFITKISPCSFNPSATCPTWETFLKRIMTDEESLTFLQTAMGYSLTGSVAEECLFILWGNGANGKSTYLDTLLYCLGDYGQAMSPSVLLSENRDGVNSDDVARLFGTRCAVAVETKKGGAFNCEKVKALTGGDRISACRKYESPFEFEPTHKIWLATNFQPPIKDNDDGIWRRVRLVEFSAVIADAEKDTALKGRGGKLAMEADGILTWMVHGLKRWLSDGLPIPQRVKDATAAYRADSDVFGQFILSTCIIRADAFIKASDLYRAYQEWAEINGMNHPMTAVTMANALKQRGYFQIKRTDANYRSGIGLGDTAGDDRTF